jgi:hypothetical protein
MNIVSHNCIVIITKLSYVLFLRECKRLGLITRHQLVAKILLGFTVKLVGKIMSLLGCVVTYPSVLLSMLLLVEASSLGWRQVLPSYVAAKVEGICLHGNSYSQGR